MEEQHNPTDRTQRQTSRGFTLIELSIALVIIALLAASVFIGRTMIEIAAMRKDAAMVERIESAVNTFKLKYGGLPGDITNPTSKGFAATASNNDGKIWGLEVPGDVYRTTTWPGYIPEWYYVFSQLGRAGLFAHMDYDTASNTNNYPGRAYPMLGTTSGGLTMATANDRIGVIVSWENGDSYVPSGHYIRTGAYANEPFGANYTDFLQGFLPSVAKQLDTKFDDGNALGGRIRIGPNHVYQNGGALSGTSGGIGSGASYCVNSTTMDYNTAINYRSCSMRFRTSF